MLKKIDINKLRHLCIPLYLSFIPLIIHLLNPLHAPPAFPPFFFPIFHLPPTQKLPYLRYANKPALMQTLLYSILAIQYPHPPSHLYPTSIPRPHHPHPPLDAESPGPIYQSIGKPSVNAVLSGYLTSAALRVVVSVALSVLKKPDKRIKKSAPNSDRKRRNRKHEARQRTSYSPSCPLAVCAAPRV